MKDIKTEESNGAETEEREQNIIRYAKTVFNAAATETERSQEVDMLPR